VFTFLLTLYLIIKRKKSFLGLKPLSPLRLGETINTLGASFVKLAQVLATRADFFSPAYLQELKKLHDDLPPMTQIEFDRVFMRAFKAGTFKHFETSPIASASIGQVHAAWLDDGTKVAVKVRREGIKSRVKADIVILNFFNRLFQPLFAQHTKNSIEAVVGEFSKMILQEVSLTTELQNLQKFSSIYSHSGVRFPTPYPVLCSDDALVMSFEEGFRFDDKQRLLECDVDFKSIIQTLVAFYTEQMLIKGYFHADPHPGNVLVTPEGELVLLDFGMVKTVPNASRIAIIELLKAANEQDYELYISASKRLGTVAYEAPTAELAEFTAKMFEIFSNDNLTNESMQELAFGVLESTRNLPFKLPSDAIYILRVSAIVEGLGTTYIPNFNGIKDILPILQQNLPRALGAKESVLETLVQQVKDLPFVITDIKHSMKKISEGSLQVELSNDQLSWAARELKSYVKSTLISLSIFMGALGVLLYDTTLYPYALALFGIGFLRILYK
jgi:predicted unusual protein kinase regulating ubiquinone biosynthesis (AarF/ABC1/UbiB family)